MYILTHSGRRFSFSHPDISQVFIPDIAHALAYLNRFTGHAKFALPVAQHSLAVADYLEALGEPPVVVLAGLLHDSHEAYFSDISSPLKAFLGVSAEEERIQQVVLAAAGLPLSAVKNPKVKEADLVALDVEARHLLPPDSEPWPILAHITDEMRARMPVPQERLPREVKAEFLSRYHHLVACLRPDVSLAH